MVSENDANFEEVLNQLELQRQQMEKAREEAEALHRETLRQKEKSDALRRNIEKFALRGAAEAIFKDMQELMSKDLLKLIKEDSE
jgi:hypothetical protein